MLSVNHRRQRSAAISSTTIGTNWFRVGGIRCAMVMDFGKYNENFERWKFGGEWLCITGEEEL